MLALLLTLCANKVCNTQSETFNDTKITSSTRRSSSSSAQSQRNGIHELLNLNSAISNETIGSTFSSTLYTSMSLNSIENSKQTFCLVISVPQSLTFGSIYRFVNEFQVLIFVNKQRFFTTTDDSAIRNSSHSEPLLGLLIW